MSTFTPNLNLEKPDPTDLVDVGVLNSNSDLIDAAYGRTPDGSLIGDTLFAYCTMDEVFTQFVFNTINQLQIPINYTGIYTVESQIFYKSDVTTRDFGVGLYSDLAGGTVSWYGLGVNTAAGDADSVDTWQCGARTSGGSTESVLFAGMTTNTAVTLMKGIYDNTGTTPTGANFIVRCFPSSDGGSVTVLADSWLKLQRVA